MNIRVARSNQSEQQILENIHAVLVQAVEHIPKKWGNVQVGTGGLSVATCMCGNSHGVLEDAQQQVQEWIKTCLLKLHF
jgi:hypothetical protein